MSVPTGYRLDRVESLHRHTLRALDELGSLNSDDPAAAHAMRALTLTRRNLEDHWLPLLLAIRASEAMRTWTPSALAKLIQLTGWTSGRASAGPSRTTRFTDSTDEYLVEFLRQRSHPFLDHHPDDVDPELAAEVADRVAADPEFAARLLDHAVELSVLGAMLDTGRFGADFATEVTKMLLRVDPQHLDGGARPLARNSDRALRHLTEHHPQRVLDVLNDRRVLLNLTLGADHDQSIVERAVTVGLTDVPNADSTRVAEAYAVLTELTGLARDRFDSGMEPGFARGLATSMGGFVDTLAPHLLVEREHTIFVKTSGRSGEFGADLDVELGAYNDLRDLIGAVVRDPQGQATLGIVMGAHIDAVMRNDVGPTRRRGAVDFADLLGDAAANEQAELVMAAAAAEARRKRLGDAIGFGLGLGLNAAGVSSITRSVTDRVISTTTAWAGDTDADDLAGSELDVAASDAITVAALDVLATGTASADTAHPDTGDMGTVTAAEWSELRRLLDTPDLASPDPIVRRSAVESLTTMVATVPALDAYLSAQRDIPGITDLTEARD